MREAPRLRDLWVEGEVGQVSISSAGHCYFTLKDERAQLRCMIFRDDRLLDPVRAPDRAARWSPTAAWTCSSRRASTSST